MVETDPDGYWRSFMSRYVLPTTSEMANYIVNALSRIRRPEYTGANRCVPCTVANTLIAVGIAGVLAWLVSSVVAVLALGVLIGVVYLRGYLVPGTPELTDHYLPASVLRRFGKDVPRETLGDLDSEGVWNALDTAGVVDRNASVRLDDEFRERWWAEIRTNRDGDLGETDIAAMMDADAETITQRGDRAFSVGGNRLLRWDSDAALLADVAASTVLRDRFGDWSDLDSRTRRDLLGKLRLLLDRCPICDGSTHRKSDHADPCCQPSHTVVWTDCASCGAFLAESATTDPSDDDLGGLVDTDTVHPPA